MNLNYNLFTLMEINLWDKALEAQHNSLNRDKSKILVVLGDKGVGKTQFIASINKNPVSNSSSSKFMNYQYVPFKEYNSVLF